MTKPSRSVLPPVSTAGAVAAAALAGVLLATSSATATILYDLGTLGGTLSEGSLGSGVNASGQVTGSSYGSVLIDHVYASIWHAFLYTGAPDSGGSMADLGTLGGRTSLGYAINASGQVTGSSLTSGDGLEHAFLYTGTPGRGGSMADLGSLGGISYGSAINASGQVAGTSSTSDGVPHAFLYTGMPGSGGVMHDLGTLGGTFIHSFAFGINDSGQIVGSNYTAFTAGFFRTAHAFLYTGTPGGDGVMHDLGTLGGTQSEAWAINNAGQVVGSSGHAFLYTGTPGSDGVMHDLGTLGGGYSIATAINNAGQVVGYSSTADGSIHAFLYSGTPGAGGAMIDLDAWLDANDPEGAKWELYNGIYKTGLRLNDHGLITGTGLVEGDPGGGISFASRAFLLNASALIPEPVAGTLALVGASSILLLRRRSRWRPNNVSLSKDQPCD